MELNLNGKVVVVTGGSSGIGEETAMEFAREGCEVTIASRSEKKLAEAAGRFEVEGFQVHTQVVDVSKPEDISALGEKVFQQFGRIDVWINNAGGNITKPFLELTVEDWNFVISTNMTSVFWGTHVAVDYMRRTGGGVILNTSSYMALIPATQKIAYAATKAGIVNMTKTTAGELAPLGIRVNCVVPGLIQTPIAAERIAANREKLCAQIALQRFGVPCLLFSGFRKNGFEHLQKGVYIVMELNLNGKVVVVTGGSSGIGEETAMEFAREGCEVTIASRSEKKLAEAAGRFEVEGFQVHTQVVDVSKPEDISALGEKVFQQFGRIDVWINNAGGNITKPFLELTVEDWNFVISTNMTSVFWGTHVAVDYMRRTGGGVILNTSSYMALIPATQKIAYAATKAGIVNMTKTTAGELAPLGIRVNCVVPGLIQTPIAAERIAANREKLCAQIALQRFGVPSDVSRVYTFLASDAAAFITGAAIEVSGGKLCVQDIGAPWGKQI